jgi:hypothetical protein
MSNIVHRVGFKASMDKVYQALATREGVSGWWSNDVKGECKVGGVLSFTFSADGKVIGVIDVKVVELAPGKRVLWQVVGGPDEWIGTEISFDLRQEGADWVIVLFKHEGWKEQVEFMYHCSTKWATFLLSAKSLVETGKGTPAPNDIKVGHWH